MVIKLLYIVWQLVAIVIVAAYVGRNKDYDFLEVIGRSSIYVTLCNIGVATVLATLGNYSLWMLCAIDILISVVLFSILKYKKQVWLVIKNIFTIKINPWKLAAGVLIVALFFLFPTNYMLAGRDPGLYYLNGIHIAQTGEYQYEDDNYLNEHKDELENVITPGYPGLYSDYELGYSDSYGSITPQFMPAYSVAMAIGYDLGGISAMIRVNAYITCLSLLMAFYFARKFFSEKVAYISVVLLALSPAQLWYGRNSVSEILLQLIVILAVDLFASGYEKKTKYNSIICGLLLGFGVMVRIDAYIMGAGLMVMWMYTALFSREKEDYTVLAVINYATGGALSFVYGIIWSKPYFISHIKNGTLSKVLCLNILLLIVALIVSIISRSINKKKQYNNYVISAFNNDTATFVIYIALLIVWGYAYFFRSMGMSADEAGYFKCNNIFELSWYTTSTIMVLAIVGLIAMLYKTSSKNESVFLYLAIGLSNYVGYGINPYISSDHIWASRRWVTIIIPFLMILGAHGLVYMHQVLKEKHKVIASVVCGIIFVSIPAYLLYHNKAFATTCIMEDLDTQVECLAVQLEDDVLYITDNEEVASYLRFVYNKKVYMTSMEDNQDGIEQYIYDNQEIMYIGNYAAIEELNCEKELINFYETKGWFLQKTKSIYPMKLYERTKEASIYRLY